jgi:hypothetical protein
MGVAERTKPKATNGYSRRTLTSAVARWFLEKRKPNSAKANARTRPTRGAASGTGRLIARPRFGAGKALALAVLRAASNPQAFNRLRQYHSVCRTAHSRTNAPVSPSG